MTYLLSTFLLLCMLAGFVFFGSLALIALQLVLLAVVEGCWWVWRAVGRKTP